MNPIKSHTRIVAMDYGQFYLQDDYVDDAFLDSGHEPTDRSQLIDQAHNNQGIASDGHEIVIISPAQYNFEMKLCVELWNQKPTGDLDAWQEAFQSHITLSKNVLIYSDVLYDDECRFDVPSGQYHLIITGRGFVDDPYRCDSQDSWRIQLWQGQAPFQHKRLKRVEY